MSRKRTGAVETEALARHTSGRPVSRVDTGLGGTLPELQQSIGNRAVARLLRAPRPAAGQPGSGAAKLQRAGDPQGLMKEHHASKFTYHHIIPENKLLAFWNKLKAKGHLPLIQTGLKSVTTRGLAQFDEAALSNIKLDLNKEIKPVVESWDESKFKEVLADGKLGGSSEALAKKFFPGIEEPGNFYNSSYRPIIDIFNKRFKLVAETSTAAIAATVGAEGDGYLADEHAAAGVEQLLMWMPGNIHRGPSTRFQPDDKGMHHKDLDDGGKEFEEAAKLIISDVQFQTVKALDDAISRYNKPSGDTEDLKTVPALLDAMKSYSVHDYDETEWVEETRQSTNKKTTKKAWTFKKKQ